VNDWRWTVNGLSGFGNQTSRNGHWVATFAEFGIIVRVHFYAVIKLKSGGKAAVTNGLSEGKGRNSERDTACDF